MHGYDRTTVDLSGYPDLVVIYLGMRPTSARGWRSALRFGPLVDRAVADRPEGLLLHERIIYSLVPLHMGMRQYWRDFDALEAWARSGAHLSWWRELMRDARGVSIWHETYFMRGGMEALYGNMPPYGMSRFAPTLEARGSMFSARRRLGLAEETADPTEQLTGK